MHYIILTFNISSHIVCIMYQVSAVHADKADKEAQKFKIGIAAAVN